MQTNKRKVFTVRSMCLMAVLSALSAGLMILEFPLTLVAPNFYQLNFSEVTVLLGAFSLGTIHGVIIEFLKIVLYMIIKPTTTAYVGELANFIMGCAFIIPASLIYKHRGTFRAGLAGVSIGTASMAIVAAVVNYFILIPMYERLFGFPIPAIIAAGAEINPAINSLFMFVLLATVPFNLIKGIFSSILVLSLYKRLQPILRR